VALDPDIKAWLKERAADQSAADASVAGRRQHAEAVTALAASRLRTRLAAVVESDAVVASGTGRIPVRVFEPKPNAGLAGAVPTVVFFHGGGWITGNPRTTHRQHARRLCVQAGARVVSVDYRLAPEHVFPAAFEDCLAVTRSCAAEAATARGSSSPLAVAGDSAGGQLAASVALACRDEGIALAAQLLIVPATDASGGYADPGVNGRYPSRRENAEGFGLTTAGMGEVVRWYGAGSGAHADWRLSPSAAESHGGLAPAIIYTSGYDVLRDEGAHYAEILRAAGVAVLHRLWPSLNHGFFGLGGVSQTADRAAEQACRDLAGVLAGIGVRFLADADASTGSTGNAAAEVSAGH
jgi:acetyl esterase